MQVLMIEDNESVCKMVNMFFKKEGFTATFSHDGQQGLDLYKTTPEQFDIVIVDLMLPSLDGMSIVMAIRETSKVPIIILTAKESEADQVLGLELGADDYVTKPFNALTLMARIKAVTRRSQTTEKEAVVDTDTLTTAYFKISRSTHELFFEDTPVAALTPKEFDLLYYLMSHPRQVFSREQLLEQVWGYQFYGDERTVDVHIKRLRKKISTEDHAFIHTVWGIGYKFDETE